MRSLESISERIDELAELKAGWYGIDGNPGEDVSPESVTAARKALEIIADVELAERPFIAPDPEGILSYEWFDLVGVIECNADGTYVVWPADSTKNPMKFCQGTENPYDIEKTIELDDIKAWLEGLNNQET